MAPYDLVFVEPTCSYHTSASSFTLYVNPFLQDPGDMNALSVAYGLKNRVMQLNRAVPFQYPR